MSASPKRLKSDKPKLIGTHNGSFHCDEVFACYMLLKLHPHASVIRTRDASKLRPCDIVVDVGGEYKPEEGRFDHHQKSFSHTMSSLDKTKTWSTKLSSAGLVYHHFGRELIKLLTDTGTDNDTENIERIYDKVYENFVHAVDAVDNGVAVSSAPLNYFIKTDLSSRVSDLNPAWNHPQASDQLFVRSRFDDAMAMVAKEFEGKVAYLCESWLPARKLVTKAYEERFEVDMSGEIMMLKEGGCPWMEHLIELEQTLHAKLLVKYVLYTDSNGSWRIQCVPVGLHSFENRLSLPEGWRGLREAELSGWVGVEGCVFVHVSGFIGGHKNFDGVLTMAKKALVVGVVE